MKRSLFSFILAALFLAPAAFHAADLKPLTIGGFINLGGAKDDSVNAIITKSLISFLAKLPGVVVTPYADLEKAAVKEGVWEKKKIDMEAFFNMAQLFDSKLVIVGDYKTDPAKETMVINVYLYDVVTGELKLKRTYSGSSGIDMFDTIDKMIRNVSGLVVGRTLEFAKIRVIVKESKKKYSVYLNSQMSGEASAGKDFTADVLAGGNVDVAIRIADTLQNVYQMTFKLEKDAIGEIEYQPMGTLMVSVSADDGDIFLDGYRVGGLASGKSLSVPNISAGVPHKVELKKNGVALETRTVTVTEGETQAIVFGVRPFPFKMTGYVALGVCLAALGTGLYFDYDAGQNFNAATDSFNQYHAATNNISALYSAYMDKQTAGETEILARNVLFISSGALLLYGAITGFIINEDGGMFVVPSVQKLQLGFRF